MSSDLHHDHTLDSLDRTEITRTEIRPDTSVTVGIVRAIAETEGVSPAELPLLSDVVDPEGLDALFSNLGPIGTSSVRFSFDYCGYTVVLSEDYITLLSE